MKNEALIGMGVLVTGLLCGCNQSNVTTTSDTNSTTTTTQDWQQTVKVGSSNAWENTKEVSTQAWATVKNGTLEAWTNVEESMGTATDYTYDHKDEFVAKAQADLDKLDQKISDLSDRAATASDSVKAQANIKLQELKDQRVGLNRKLEDVKNATAADWDDTKAAFKQSYDDTKTSLKNAWDWLRGKLSS